MPVYKFFSAPIGTNGNALVNWAPNPAEDLIAYAAAYRTAAMNLVASHEQRKTGNIDYQALPILFLYRHCFELCLKTIVFRAAMLTINEDELQNAIPRLWREHSLVALFEMAKPILSADTESPLTVTNELEHKVCELAQNLDEVDSGSFSFRYPVTSRGRTSLPECFMTNIFIFSAHIEGVLDDIAQFCGSLQSNRVKSSDQMKLALHPIFGQAV